MFTGARVLDPAAGVYRSTDLAVQDGIVVDEPSGAGPVDTVDLRGAYVLPGLVDCHVHVNAVTADLGIIGTWSPSYVTAGAIRRMGAMLDRGFTTVRDTGGGDRGLSAAQAEGTVRGPRLVYGGRALSQTGGHGDKLPRGVRTFEEDACCAGTARVADGVDAVRKAAREELRTGARHIKIHVSGGVSSPDDPVDSTQYSLEEIRAAVAEAEALGRYVTAHAYPARAVNRALESGVRCIEHGNLVDERSIALFQEHGAFLVPTLVTYRELWERGAEHGLPENNRAKVGALFEQGIEALERAHRGGVRLAYGTDLLGGMNARQCDEFAIRGAVQPPLEVVRAATTAAAELIGMAGRVGTLAPGAHGDLIALDADPLEDLGVLAAPERHLRRVVQGGTTVLDR